MRRSAPSLVDISALAFAAFSEIVWTSSRNNRARVGYRAPGVSRLHRNAVSTVVVSLATDGDGNASFSKRAPSKTGSTAFASTTIVVVIRAVSVNGSARVSFSAPGESWLER